MLTCENDELRSACPDRGVESTQPTATGSCDRHVRNPARLSGLFVYAVIAIGGSTWSISATYTRFAWNSVCR